MCDVIEKITLPATVHYCKRYLVQGATTSMVRQGQGQGQQGQGQQRRQKAQSLSQQHRLMTMYLDAEGLWLDRRAVTSRLSER